MQKLRVKIEVLDDRGRKTDELNFERGGLKKDLIVLASVISAVFIQSQKALEVVRRKLPKKK